MNLENMPLYVKFLQEKTESVKDWTEVTSNSFISFLLMRERLGMPVEVPRKAIEASTHPLLNIDVVGIEEDVRKSEAKLQALAERLSNGYDMHRSRVEKVAKKHNLSNY